MARQTRKEINECDIYLFCLSLTVMSLPRSNRSWQMCGWHIWVASTNGVWPSYKHTHI